MFDNAPTLAAAAVRTAVMLLEARSQGGGNGAWLCLHTGTKAATCGATLPTSLYKHLRVCVLGGGGGGGGGGLTMGQDCYQLVNNWDTNSTMREMTFSSGHFIFITKREPTTLYNTSQVY